MAFWPTSVATDAQLYTAVNSLQTTLSGSINNSVTTITLASTTGFPTAGAVTIDTEVIFYTNVSGSQLTGCTRGADGTTAASHSSGVPVGATIIAFHHNGLKDEVIAIESSLNLTASRAIVTNSSGRLAVATVTSTELGYLSGVTSAIQTQFTGKKTIATGNNYKWETTGSSGDLQETTVTASRAIASDANGLPVASATTATELGYVSGVTSSIQTQFAATVSNPLTGDLAAGSHKITGLAAATTNGDAVRYEQAVRTADDQTVTGNKTFSGTTLMTTQPSFLATMTTASNVTGDGTAYTVAYNTEVSDLGGNYNNSTFIFTAPVTGTYMFCAQIYTDQTTAAAGHGAATFQLVTSNRNYTSQLTAAGTMAGNNADRWEWKICVLTADMDVGDTAKVVFTVSGGTKVIDIAGDATSNFFCGRLLG